MEILGICRAWNDSREEEWVSDVLEAVKRCSARPVVGDRLALRCGTVVWGYRSGFCCVELGSLDPVSEDALVNKAVVGEGCNPGTFADCDSEEVSRSERVGCDSVLLDVPLAFVLVPF